MDAYGDSGELYNVRNQFYTYRYRLVREIDPAAFSAETRLKALEFKIRLMHALGEDALDIIASSRNEYPDDASLFQVLDAWNALAVLGADTLAYFDALAEPQFELEAVLLAHYYARYRGEPATAIEKLTQYIETTKAYTKYNELEVFLTLAQLHLAHGSQNAAFQVFERVKKFPKFATDNILYQILEAWVLAIRGGSDRLKNSYSFFDELLEQDFDADAEAKFRALNALFVLSIQLKRYPEAQQVLAQILESPVAATGDSIANRIAFDYTVNNGSGVGELMAELEKVEPTHAMLLDYREKSAKFDAIVEKFKITA